MWDLNDSVAKSRAESVARVKKKYEEKEAREKEEKLARFKPKVKEVPLMKSNKPSMVDDIQIQPKEKLTLF